MINFEALFFAPGLKTRSSVHVAPQGILHLPANLLSPPPNTRWARNRKRRTSSKRDPRRPSITAARCVKSRTLNREMASTGCVYKATRRAVTPTSTTRTSPPARPRCCTAPPTRWPVPLSLRRSARTLASTGTRRQAA